MKVLVVEDEPMIGLGLEDEIHDAGHTVLGPVESTGAALLLTQSERPAVALIDLDLRYTQDGIRLARELKMQGVPSVVITYDPERAEQSCKVAIGAIAKPFNLDTIPAMLDVVAEIFRGGSPPPPTIPPALRLFHLESAA
jgi:two-component system, response regulator PdtaR